MKKSLRFVGKSFRYFSYFLGATTIYVALTDPEYAKKLFDHGVERGQTR